MRMNMSTQIMNIPMKVTSGETEAPSDWNPSQENCTRHSWPITNYCIMSFYLHFEESFVFQEIPDVIIINVAIHEGCRH